MQKDIDLEQIIFVLSLSNSQQDHMSFRLSDDYQPNYFRYSKDDQLQQITFNLSNEQEESLMARSHEAEVKITQESPNDRICFLLEESKEQAMKQQPPEKLPAINKKISLNRKTSIKASELLKKKISLKKQTDEFTKKYDDLFDEIFFKQKAKEKKEEAVKQQKEDKKQHSLNSTAQNLSGSNVSSQNNLSISRAIDEVLINSFNSLTDIEQKNQPNPKVNITYETKIVINIKPPKQCLLAEQPEPNNSKPKIKFSYGQTQTEIAAKKLLILDNVPYHVKEEDRLPKFMLTFRSKTNSYPNFYSKNGFTEESCNKYNAEFLEILQECKKCIKSLKQAHLNLHEQFTKIKQLYKLLSLNILNHNSEEDQTLLDYYLNQDWAVYLKIPQLQNIKPRDYFLSRPFNELEFITFINNFEQLAIRLQSQVLLNAQNPQSIKAYMHGRDKLWGIQKNLRLLSEDLYLYSISHFNLPNHFLQSYRLLTSLRNNEVVKFDYEKDALLKRLLFLQENKDIFGSSWLGHYTIEKLCSMKK